LTRLTTSRTRYNRWSSFASCLPVTTSSLTATSYQQSSCSIDHGFPNLCANSSANVSSGVNRCAGLQRADPRTSGIASRSKPVVIGAKHGKSKTKNKLLRPRSRMSRRRIMSCRRLKPLQAHLLQATHPRPPFPPTHEARTALKKVKTTGPRCTLKTTCAVDHLTTTGTLS